MATAARRIVVRRKKLAAIQTETIIRHQQALDAARYTSGSSPMYCMWCFTEKSFATEKCTSCGRFGTTNRTQREISQVFIISGDLD